ncbi:hypothetical protein [Fusibacter ferrireducens]|uniref:DUF350 domain-containing protein n=1 Tax=Fusibacter ferrireducens TaxID=2785058 RepID=A0ABR9ZM24_9FIRM|nr:hypothetical protein [Fusibacter ferrireducens]MBF4691525.1 hypothetical protein [Fusibacter ferrireducens]
MFLLGFIISAMILYFYTMKTIHKIIHGKEVAMDSKLTSDILAGSILVGVTMFLFINGIMS